MIDSNPNTQSNDYFITLKLEGGQRDRESDAIYLLKKLINENMFLDPVQTKRVLENLLERVVDNPGPTGRSIE